MLINAFVGGMVGIERTVVPLIGAEELGIASNTLIASFIISWRDLGYAIGALSAGLIADFFGLAWAIGAVAGLTFLSGAVVAVAMQEDGPA